MLNEASVLQSVCSSCPQVVQSGFLLVVRKPLQQLATKGTDSAIPQLIPLDKSNCLA